MANAVAAYVDGVGNKVNAIQWDGDPATAAAIKAWTAKATLDRRGTMGIQTPTNRLNVGLSQWLVMDSNHQPQLFPMTNGQFVATYAAQAPATQSAPVPGA